MKFAHPIAVVGIGGIFPGVRELSSFWKNIKLGINSAKDVPTGRWALSIKDAYSPSKPEYDRVYSRRGCFIDDFSVSDFMDLEKLGLKSSFVEKLDPLYHLTLIAGVSAFNEISTKGLDLKRTGIIIGNIALPTEKSSKLSWEILGRTFEEKILPADKIQKNFTRTHPINRYVTGMPAGLLAKALKLGGGTYTIDAACASSLYALKMACIELLTHRADAMISGGVARPDSLYTQMGFSQLRALSPDGICSPFDKKWNGLVIGEGAGMVVLKRLEDAVNSGDQIYGIIREIGLSNDMDGNLLAPSFEGQLRAMLPPYKLLGLEPSDIDIIECHATGTPVGDSIEVESLKKLWQDCNFQKGQCVIGSIKSNIGHLLTAAGAAGLIKILLAMRNKTYPPTANFSSPALELNLPESPFRVLTSAEPWKKRDENIPRRAAINAFGFGGINAHVIIEEWNPGRQSRKSQFLIPPLEKTATEIAVIGMDAYFGQWSSLKAFQERIQDQNAKEEPVQKENWFGVPQAHWFKENYPEGFPFKGFPLEEISVKPGEFRIPPKELEEMLPQQLLMLKIAEGALSNSGCKNSNHINSGVFIGLGLDLNTNNFHLRWEILNYIKKWAEELSLDISPEELEEWSALLRDAAGPPLTPNRTMGALGSIVASRIGREFRFGGPSFTISSEESSGIKALEAAVRKLQFKEIDLALVGAVDFSADIRALIGSYNSRNKSAVNLENPAIFGEGASAVILKRLSDARENNDKIYAVIKGIGTATGEDMNLTVIPDNTGYKTALKRAYEDAQIKPDTINYLEIDGGSNEEEGRMEIKALTEFFHGIKGVNLPAALGTIKEDIGCTGNAGGLASLVKVCLCLYNQILPGVKNFRNSLFETNNGRNVFYIPKFTQHWLRNRNTGPRRAGISSFSIDGNSAHVVLEEYENNKEILKNKISPLADIYKETIFVAEGNNTFELQEDLRNLKKTALNFSDTQITALAGIWHRENFGVDKEKKKAVSFVTKNKNELLYQIEKIEKFLDISPQKPLSPDFEAEGIFYYPSPMGLTGKIAFVFPGSGNHYSGMGRKISLSWPEIFIKHDLENKNLYDQILPDYFWNDDLQEPDNHLKELIFGQVTFGTIVSDVLQTFKINPKAVIGYSLGETAGLFALGAWRDRDLMLGRMNKSKLFTEELAGDMKASKKLWKIPEENKLDWCAGVVDISADKLKNALRTCKRVYLLIINTPKECVIGGEKQAVLKLVEELGCNFWKLEGISTVHCEVAEVVKKAYRDLHLFNTTPPDGIDFYGAWVGKKYKLTSEAAADSIVSQAVYGFNFPCVINSAFNDGVNIFIEIGPGKTCSRMIEKILEGKQHFAMSASIPQQNEVSTILRLLASLSAHRVPMDLKALYEKYDTVKVETSLAQISHGNIMVLAGGKPFKIPRISYKTKTARESVPVFSKIAEKNYHISSTKGFEQAQSAKAEAHETYLRLSKNITDSFAKNLEFQMELLAKADKVAPDAILYDYELSDHIEDVTEPPILNREMCMEFAIGKIANVLGPYFSEVDSFPTRVRLPDEPLMLVDRILSISGEPGSLTSGTIVTEHDILKGSWYLDNNCIPTGIAVEAGQADLFLSGYLGIDLKTRGLALYRLLDAEVTFHRELPGPGNTIKYEIEIERFFQQGNTYFFNFSFESTVNGEPLITMRNGCAGFFTLEELNSGQGIVHTSLDSEYIKGKKSSDFEYLVPMAVEAYSDEQIEELRRGRLEGCFGPLFEGISLKGRAHTIPGGRLNLVKRVLHLDPAGGRYRLGQIRAEADIHPDDWYLTCHFFDDNVMPGTLMYECCMHTGRIFLLRMGWIAQEDNAAWEPVPGVKSFLKCRGQVLGSTKRVIYEISIKELGYRPQPYAIADGLIYADDKPIVEIKNMSLQLSGITRDGLLAIWKNSAGKIRETEKKPAIFDNDKILAFAVGEPSAAFGEPFKIFDGGKRFIARLPGPPYKFLDRITEINATALKMTADQTIEAQYEIPQDAWYFHENRQDYMPFAVLLEIALQPCGWLAAYLGSALTCDTELYFRNLGGEGVLYEPVTKNSGLLTTKIKVTKVASSGDMIIQDYEFEIFNKEKCIYKGNTYFGFFSKEVLSKQVGIIGAKIPEPDITKIDSAKGFSYPDEPPFPCGKFKMIDKIEFFIPGTNTDSFGYIRGTMNVNPKSWFFKAHFYRDPVCPGSLGIESMLQLLKFYAYKKWNLEKEDIMFTVSTGVKHKWTYRGQVVPENKLVTVDSRITSVDNKNRVIFADGFLSVDNLIIYEMRDFSLRILKNK